MRVSLLLVGLLAALVSADVYMHSPPGSNDRNRERNDNRNNGNRLFDSQNNDKGGYAWRGDPAMRGSLLYDSIPDPIVYYVGSRLRMEWTNQHGCGPNPNVHCQLVIQYACHNHDLEEPGREDKSWMQGLRDGYPMTAELVSNDNTYDGYRKLNFQAQVIPGTGVAQNQAGTETIPDNAFVNDPAAKEAFYYRGQNGGMEFGMHEGIAWYEDCRNTERNRGLYTSDQNLINRNSARNTRQNPNGNRNGLECPEERDYYPYWRPTPWRDVAVLTSNTEWCSYFKDHSQNVVSSWYCECDSVCRNAAPLDLIPINNETCTTAGGTWTEREKLGGGAPDCLYHAFGRDNHLGNAAEVNAKGEIILGDDLQPETASYTWIIPPEAEGKHCVVRIRYNMSTFDYPSHQHAVEKEEERAIFDASKNCPVRGQLPVRVAQGLPLPEDLTGLEDHCHGLLREDEEGNLIVPLFERPYINLFNDTDAKQLQMAINTDQTGRTFQDRSHVFKVARKPVEGKVYNLNVRGRRGNIVQAYPSVEYDFVPNILKVTEDDWVHIQLHGSDFNDDKNANNGEGWRYSDRHNLIEMPGPGGNYPVPMHRMKMFNDRDAKFFGLLEQTNCGVYHYNGNDNDRTTVQNQADNCAQLNRAPQRFPREPRDGLVKFKNGHYYYMSSRSNCFSNRSQKAQLIVGDGAEELSTGEKAAIGLGVIAAAGVLVGGALFYGKKNPDTAMGTCFAKTSEVMTCQTCRGSSGASTAGSTAAPDMDYQRH